MKQWFDELVNAMISRVFYFVHPVVCSKMVYLVTILNVRSNLIELIITNKSGRKRDAPFSISITWYVCLYPMIVNTLCV